jgi:Cys-rich repeat protein
MTLRHAFALSAALGAGLMLLGQACLPSARFPSCETSEDCAKNDKAKLCFDTRCVECQSDGDCGDGRYCETNSRECKSLGEIGATSQSAAPSAEAAPEASAAP